MKEPFIRMAFVLSLAACLMSYFLSFAHAQSSLGIGTNEVTLPSTGFFGPLLNWINVHQQAFYRALTGALKEIRSDGSKLWLLIGLSFAYGVFHAAGPGHGKAVISSYMVANEVALRRGIMLSFVSAFLQALTAIIVMMLVFLVLRGTTISMNDATWFLEVVSYALISCFGAWLLWQKLRPKLTSWPAHSLSAARPENHSYHHHHGAHNHDHHRHTHAHGELCDTCGHSHAPDPKLLSGDHFDWRTAWSVVAAVGLRPCSGALIVLTFAFLNGLWVGGISSVIGMAIGTGVTVSILATIAVMAKNWAGMLAGNSRTSQHIHRAIEIGGAVFVLIVGLLLLTASLAAKPGGFGDTPSGSDNLSKLSNQ
ncbi:nickel/cobalt transporter [Pararhizobium sp. YC-54]|uniref:nickel/cobalt transporter n=1 Tax=Pararhizobium sp. YC-54 TaxID=2986920 RepID=UPI0021F72DB0|nr:nickel/cobalt transporter [Pararhizobium sp. YC-54]MCW0002167.1 nickel/cobalt transporter [Pararhizobium sp. YC-54]